MRRLPAGLEGSAKLGEPFAVERVPHPLAAPVSAHEAGLAQDLDVVGDRGLALAEWPYELTHADLTVR